MKMALMAIIVFIKAYFLWFHPPLKFHACWRRLRRPGRWHHHQGECYLKTRRFHKRPVSLYIAKYKCRQTKIFSISTSTINKVEIETAVIYVRIYLLSISSRRYANCCWSCYSYKLIIIFCLKFHKCNRLSKSASVGHDIMREAGHCNYRFVHEMALWASMAIIPIAWETAHAKSSGLRTAHYSLKKDAVQQIWW